MLVLIPVNYDRKCYIKFIFLFFPFAQWTQWHTVMVHRMLFHSFHWLKKEFWNAFFQILTNILCFFFVKFNVQTSCWTEHFKQYLRLYLVLGKVQIHLHVQLHISFDFLTCVPIYCCAVVQTCTSRNRKSSNLGIKVSHHQKSHTLLCIISLLHAVHTSSGYLDLFYAQCTDQITVRSVACSKLKVSQSSGVEVKGSVNRQWRNEFQNN
jgi:hypothetical protein